MLKRSRSRREWKQREMIRQTHAFTASERGSHITHPSSTPSLFVFLSFPVSVMRTQLNPSACLCLRAVFSVWSAKPWVLVIWVIRTCVWTRLTPAGVCDPDAAALMLTAVFLTLHNLMCFTVKHTQPHTPPAMDTRSMKHASTDGEDLTQQPDRQRHTREIHLPLTSWKLRL